MLTKLEVSELHTSIVIFKPNISFRLFEWIFYNVNSDENSDVTKAVFLRGLHELLLTEGGKSPHAPMLPVS